MVQRRRSTRSAPAYALRAKYAALLPLQRAGHVVSSVENAVSRGLLTHTAWLDLLNEHKEAWERETGLSSLVAYSIEARRANAVRQRQREREQRYAAPAARRERTKA